MRIGHTFISFHHHNLKYNTFSKIHHQPPYDSYPTHTLTTRVSTTSTLTTAKMFTKLRRFWRRILRLRQTLPQAPEPEPAMPAEEAPREPQPSEPTLSTVCSPPLQLSSDHWLTTKPARSQSSSASADPPHRCSGSETSGQSSPLRNEGGWWW